MSAKNPEWYELPKKSWIELNSEGTWDSFRDSQRQKLYDAEDRFRNRFREQNPKFSSIEEISQYVNKLAKSAWAIKRWGSLEHDIIVKEGKFGTGGSAKRYGLIITLSQWGWNKVVVLHELAHLFSYYGTSHGRHFARTFLELIEHEMGPDARKALKEAYKCHGVKSNPIPQYSEETKTKMRLRGHTLIKQLQRSNFI